MALNTATILNCSKTLLGVRPVYSRCDRVDRDWPYVPPGAGAGSRRCPGDTISHRSRSGGSWCTPCTAWAQGRCSHGSTGGGSPGLGSCWRSCCSLEHLGGRCYSVAGAGQLSPVTVGWAAVPGTAGKGWLSGTGDFSVPYSTSCQCFSNPGALAACAALAISRVHSPVGSSPQKCTERKGQSSKLVASLSLGRGSSREDLG